MAAPATTDDPRFDELYTTYCARVLAYAMRRVAPADAEDATSDTFLIAWRRMADLPSGEEALPWLYATCRNVIANQRRGRRRWSALIEKLTRGSSENELSGRTEGGIAMETLRRLRTDDQEVLRLVAWEGLSHAQAGRVLGLTANAVAIRAYRARARFREAYRLSEHENALKGPAPSRTSVTTEGTISARMNGE